MKAAEKFTDETNRKNCSGEMQRQRDLYRERCIRLQKENEDLKRMLDKIQIMVYEYSNG